MRGDVAAAQAHIRACDGCREYFSQDRDLLALYDEVRRAPAPVSLKQRVTAAIAGARSVAVERPWWTRRTTMAGAATAGIVAAGLALLMFMEVSTAATTTSDAPDVFVEDYLRRAVAGDFIETSAPAEVTRFLQRELGLRLEPLRAHGLKLMRAEICLLEGRRGAMIQYERDGAVVSHYLIPRDDAVERAPALALSSTDRGASEMPVVTWAGGRVEQALVGEIDSDALLAIANEQRAGR